MFELTNGHMLSEKKKWLSRIRFNLIDVCDSSHFTADIISVACNKKKSIVGKISKIINWNNFYVHLLTTPSKMFPKCLQPLSKLFIIIRKLKNYCLKYQSYDWNFQLCVRNCQRKLLANLGLKNKDEMLYKEYKVVTGQLENKFKS